MQLRTISGTAICNQWAPLGGLRDLDRHLEVISARDANARSTKLVSTSSMSGPGQKPICRTQMLTSATAGALLIGAAGGDG